MLCVHTPAAWTRWWWWRWWASNGVRAASYNYSTSPASSQVLPMCLICPSHPSPVVAATVWAMVGLNQGSAMVVHSQVVAVGLGMASRSTLSSTPSLTVG